MKDLSKYLKAEKKGLIGLKAKVLQSVEPEVMNSRSVQAYQPVSEWVTERHDSDSESDPLPLDQDGDLDLPIKPPTTVRDPAGRPIDPLTYRPKEVIAKEENERAVAQWSGGVIQAAQKRLREERLREEATKPFSRYEIESEADQELRQKDRFGDPLALFRPASPEANPSSNALYAASNRFAIAPGSRWDGVDRSNGFEVKYLSALAASKAKAPEAYREANLDL